MSRSISLSEKHALGIPAMKQRIGDRFETLKTTYIDKVGGGEMNWVDDTANVKVSALGQQINAQIVVREHDFTIDVQLPWILAGFSSTLESILKSNADVAHADPPAADIEPGAPS